MARKLVEVMLTAQGKAISTGRAGPSCHCIVPVARNSLVLLLLVSLPPTMNTPMSLSVAAALLYLTTVRFPILFLSQRWLIGSSTRQEAVKPSEPPQVATRAEGSDVTNVV